MNIESENSGINNAKSLVRQQLSIVYPINFANLIVDRLFSKIPMYLRFTTKESSGELQQELIHEAMLKIRMSKRDGFRDLFLVGFLFANLCLAMVFNRSRVEKFTNSPSFIYSLTPEQILSKGNTAPLGKFLREPRFSRLFLGKHLVVESKKLYKFFGQNSYEDIEIVFDTSLWIAKNKLPRKIVLRVIRESISRFIQVIRKGKQEEIQVLRELVIDEPVWRYYLEEAPQTDTTNVVTTQSQFLRLPYAFYIDVRDRIARSMLWYSTNSNAIENRKTRLLFDPEHFRFNNIDNHFVWTSEQKQTLVKYNPSANIVVAGSILFKPVQNVERNNQNSNPSIVIFDVTPFNGLDVQVFYTREILTEFIEDLVSALSSNSNTNSATVLLKPKRNYARKLRGGLSPSSEYTEQIGKLQRLNSIEVLNPDVDLYQLVKNASLVIGIPFTSPVILAKEMNVPSFFYVPESAKDWIIGDNQDGVAVIHGRSQLKVFIENLD